MQNQYPTEDLSLESSLEIGGVAKDEISRLKEYEKIYASTHPYPSKPVKKSFWQVLGFEAVAFYLAALGGVVVAAVRTGGIFMATEEMIIQGLGVTSNSFYKALPVITMIASLFAFELYLFAIGLRKGRESGKLNTSWWGTGAAGAVSILAGAISSLPLVGVGTTNGIGLYFSWLLVIGMSAGATILAYLGAENIGVLHNVYDQRLIDVIAEYNDLTVKWYQKMQTDYRNKGRNRVFGLDSYRNEKVVTEEDKKEVKNVQGSIRNYLSDRSLSAFDIGPANKGHAITPKMIADELNLTSAADTSNVRVALNRLRDEEKRE